MIDRALVLPMPPALLPPISVQDPVADVRAACREALVDLLSSRPADLWVVAPPVSALNEQHGIEEPLGHRVGRHLLAETGLDLPRVHYASTASDLGSASGILLVMADGSARRHEKAPGHFHPDAVGFDTGIGQALRAGDASALAALSPEVGAELWCQGVPAFRALGELAADRRVTPRVTYADAPYGVAWWVARWDLG